MLAKINCITEQFLLYFVFVVSFPQIVLLPPLPPNTILTVETHYFPVSYISFGFSRSATILLLRLTLRLARCWHLVSRDMSTSSPKSVLKPVKNMLSKRFFEFLVYAFLIDWPFFLITRCSAVLFRKLKSLKLLGQIKVLPVTEL